MNRYMLEKWPWIEGSHGMRSQLLDVLSDADLAFSPGGQNMALGALCRQMGEVEHSYIESLKTFQQDWSYRNTEADLESSAARLKAWFQTLDDSFKATVSALSTNLAGWKRVEQNQLPVQDTIGALLTSNLTETDTPFVSHFISSPYSG